MKSLLTNLIKIFIARNLKINPPAPALIFLEVNKRCNLHCQFCSRGNKKHNDSYMTLDEIYKLIEETSMHGTSLFHLHGGEPLLNKNIYDIIKHIKNNRMNVSIVTNGTLLTEQNLYKLKKAGIDSLFVSLESHIPSIHNRLRNKEDGFKRVVSGIKRARDILGDDATIIINTLITQKNYKDMSELAKFSKSLGVKMIRFNPVHDIPFFGEVNKDIIPKKDDIQLISKEIIKLKKTLKSEKMISNSDDFLDGICDFFSGEARRVRCYAGYFVCNVAANGNLYLCNTIPEIAGNVKENGFMTAWKSKRCNKVREIVRSRRCNCWQSGYIDSSYKFSPLKSLKNMPRNLEEAKCLFSK